MKALFLTLSKSWIKWLYLYWTYCL